MNAKRRWIGLTSLLCGTLLAFAVSTPLTNAQEAENKVTLPTHAKCQVENR